MGIATWIAELFVAIADGSLLIGHRRRRPETVALAHGPESPAARFLGRDRIINR